jgi:hypothetical protein
MPTQEGVRPSEKNATANQSSTISRDKQTAKQRNRSWIIGKTSPVHGELILKLLQEAGIAIVSEFSNESYSTSLSVLEYLQLLHEQTVGDDGLCATWSEEFGVGGW